MLSVREAMEMELSDELNRELESHNPDSILVLTQNNTLHVVPATPENVKMFRIQDIYEKYSSGEELSIEDIEFSMRQITHEWNPPCVSKMSDVNPNVITIDISHLIEQDLKNL